MASAVNAALLLDALLLLGLAYRISWATGPYGQLSPPDAVIKRNTLRAYYTGLVLSVAALLSAGAHIIARDVVLAGPAVSTGFAIWAAALFCVAVGIAVRYGRFRDGPLIDRPRSG